VSRDSWHHRELGIAILAAGISCPPARSGGAVLLLERQVREMLDRWPSA
jgi:hypothetical protein